MPMATGHSNRAARLLVAAAVFTALLVSVAHGQESVTTHAIAVRGEPGYPAEIVRVAAEPAGARGGAIVSWETIGERGVLGFNVMRSRPGDPSEVKVNPVWIPAIGDPAGTAAYSFLDAGARRGVAYEYRIEAVTPEGLVSRSDAVGVTSR